MPLFTHPAPTPETWTPEGTLVSQRFRALEGAIVLVYTADADRGSAKYAPCLPRLHLPRRDERSAQPDVRDGRRQGRGTPPRDRHRRRRRHHLAHHPPRRPPVSRTRLERIRASVGIASLALQQIQDGLTAADIDKAELAAILRELMESTDAPGGLIPSLAQLVTVASKRAEQFRSDLDASHYLHESAALFTDHAGARLLWAAHALDPQGDPT